MKQVAAKTQGATVFGYQVIDPERFGVVEFDKDFNALSSYALGARRAGNYLH